MALTTDAKEVRGGGGGNRTRFEYSIPTIKPTVLEKSPFNGNQTRKDSRADSQFRPLCMSFSIARRYVNLWGASFKLLSVVIAMKRSEY